MTPTERIAVELLGWVLEGKGFNFSGNRYRKGEIKANVGLDGVARFSPGNVWPDLTTLDGCRAFEDALLRDGLLGRYRLELRDMGYTHLPKVTSVAEMIFMANPTQRVAACIAVLDEIAK